MYIFKFYCSSCASKMGNVSTTAFVGSPDFGMGNDLPPYITRFFRNPKKMSDRNNISDSYIYCKNARVYAFVIMG